MFTGDPKIKALDSREVAEMIGRQHNELMKTIRQFCKYLDEGEIPHVDFFIPSSYVDAKGETRSSFLVTKKGCEMIAHKMTGLKGVLFTAAYINRFHEMETQSLPPMPPEIKARMFSSVATYVNTFARVMLHEGHTWHDIGKLARDAAEAAGLPYSPLLGVPPAYEQLMLEAWQSCSRRNS